MSESEGCSCLEPCVADAPTRPESFQDYFSHWLPVQNVEFLKYLSWFPSKVSGEKIMIEASTEYATSLAAPRLMKQYLPHVRLIALLRDPVQQVYSYHAMVAFSHALGTHLRSGPALLLFKAKLIPTLLCTVVKGVQKIGPKTVPSSLLVASWER